MNIPEARRVKKTEPGYFQWYLVTDQRQNTS